MRRSIDDRRSAGRSGAMSLSASGNILALPKARSTRSCGPNAPRAPLPLIGARHPAGRFDSARALGLRIEALGKPCKHLPPRVCSILRTNATAADLDSIASLDDQPSHWIVSHGDHLTQSGSLTAARLRRTARRATVAGCCSRSRAHSSKQSAEQAAGSSSPRALRGRVRVPEYL